MTDSNRRRWVLLLVTLFAASALVPAPAMAVSASADGVPDGVRVGENVSATFTLTDLYTKAPNAWRLRATTALENASWIVTAYALDDSELASRSFRGQSFRTSVRAVRNVSRITVTVRGTAPAVENFTYRPRERFTLASLSRAHDGTSRLIKNWSVRHYTQESRSAWRTINATRTAVAENGSNDELEEQVGFAISAYRHGNFELATAIAADAKNATEDSEYPVMLLSGLFLGGIVVALGTAGIRSYRERARDDDPWRDR